MSKENDLLGRLIDTSLFSADDEPLSDHDGYTNLLTLEDDEEPTDNDDYEAYLGLREDSSPQEATEAIEFMRPLDDEERALLEEFPDAEQFTKVDDSEHEQWLLEKASQGYKGIDSVLDDASYGESNMNEERMEREDVDSESGLSGWGSRRRRKRLKKIYKAKKKKQTRKPEPEPEPEPESETDEPSSQEEESSTDESEGTMGIEERMEREDVDSESGLSGWGIKKPSWKRFKKNIRKVGKRLKKGLGAIASFVPGRDARKAKLVRNLYKKLWFEHANWLGQQDLAAGVPLQPRAKYERVAKLWARNEIKKKGMPLKYTMSGADVLGTEILGADIMGFTWSWPFANFLNFSRTIVKDTSDKRSKEIPGEQAEGAQAPGMEDLGEPPPQEDTSQEQSEAGPSEDESEGDVMDGWNSFTKIAKDDKDDMLGIGGEDSLGAFAAQILGRTEISGMDPWLYKLNPAYWISSSRKREMTDIEKKKWTEHAQLQKSLRKQKEDLEAAERAAQAAQAVAAAREQSAATEAQLKEIAASLRGEFVGSFVGHEKRTKIADVIMTALTKLKKKDTASKLYGKIREGEDLTEEELVEAKKIARLVGRMKVVHGDLVGADAMFGAFVGACIGGKIAAVQTKNSRQGKLADEFAKKIASGQPLSKEECKVLGKLLRSQSEMHDFCTSLVSGRAFVGHPQAKALCKGAFVGAAKTMSDVEKKMVAFLVVQAKTGNPRAIKALAALKKSGEISGGDVMGLSIMKAFKYGALGVTAPLWATPYAAYKGTKWAGKKIFGKKGKGAQSVRLARMRAAAKRRQAAEARAAAADAESEAEMRAQQSIAAAAEAEADAADAAALAKEAAMKTAETEADPGASAESAESESEGEFVGASDAELDSLMKKSYSMTPENKKKAAKIYKAAKSGDKRAEASVRKIVAQSEAGDPKAKEIAEFMKSLTPESKAARVAQAKKIVEKSKEKSPTGDKIRAGEAVYAQAKAGNPKARKAIEVIQAKAAKGDAQAQRDLRAVQAGKIAYKAKGSSAKSFPPDVVADIKDMQKRQKAQRKAEVKAAIAAKREARKATVVAFQREQEARLADRLARMERKRALGIIAKFERKGAAGDPKALAYIAKQQTASELGDKKAQKRLEALKLARTVRQSATTRRERRGLKEAERLVKGLRKNDPAAWRKYNIICAAASKGDPNAIRARQRIAVASAVVAVVATGVIVQPKLAGAKEEPKAPLTSTEPGWERAQRLIAEMKAKAATGTITREEAAAGARAAQSVGDKETAGKLAMAASTAPSATEELKRAATVTAAAEQGNPEAKKQIKDSLEAAKKGDAAEIRKSADLAAVATIADLNAGKPMSPVMQEAFKLKQRADAGDPQAIEAVKAATEAATGPSPSPEATVAAVTLAAATITTKALASKPKAKAELQKKINPPLPPEEQKTAKDEVEAIMAKANEGTATPEEGARGIALASRLGQPRVAAQIAAKVPPLDRTDPLSSLPDMPLAPITGVVELIKESLRAITFSTRDPISNYRSGVAARSKESTTAPPISSSGWSPFKFFSAAKKVAPFTPFAAPIAAASAIMDLSKKKGAPKEQPAPETAPTATAGAFVGSHQPEKSIEAIQAMLIRALPGVAKEAGWDRTPIVIDSSFLAELDSSEPNKAAAYRNLVKNGMVSFASSGPRLRMVGILAEKMEGSFVGADFKVLVAEALKTKKMSKSDFNKAVDANVGPSAQPFAKKASGEQLLSFLKSKSVVVLGESLQDLAKKAKEGDPKAKEMATALHHRNETFKKLITEALKTKKMSKDDFNKAITAHVDPKADKKVKETAAEKMIKFLVSKEVKIG